MTAALPEDLHPVLDRYRTRLRTPLAGPAGSPSGQDEMLTPDGVRPGSVDLAASIDLLGVTGLLTRREQARRFVEDDGVTYGGPPVATRRRRWTVDPLPLVIDAEEWSRLEPALVQRARLLDAVLTDLYGPRTLLRERVIPAELVLGHPGFVRQADRIRIPGAHQLFLTATDLGRHADGGWRVLGDRTQAPSGAGYAMETRRIIARVLPGLHRDTPLARLRDFFHTMRQALQEMAPETAEAPRVVLLTPGAGSETAFDQAFLATLLGFPVVEAEDLTVRDGRVWLRTTGRLEPVDVVVRRVDAWFADPLELRPDSQLGVPGLIEASRTGTVTVVNTLGSGVLENPGLLPFLPAAARRLLDEDLALPSVATWWCGDPDSLRYVVDHIGDLVIKPIARDIGLTSRFGWELTREQWSELRRRIELRPWAWCAQERLEMSTAPVVTSLGLEPRRLVLRTFTVAEGGGYQVMAGGLARVAAKGDTHLISNLSGALAKDVWVLAPSEATTPGVAGAPVPPEELPAPLRLEPTPVAEAVPFPGLSPRVAEDLFWLGRYAERAEGTARLLRVADDLTQDYANRPGSRGAHAMEAVLRAVDAVTVVRHLEPPVAEGDGEARSALLRRRLRMLVTDESRPGTVAFAGYRTVAAAQAVRDQLSLDTWIVLSRLERRLAEVPADDAPLQPLLAQVLESLLALAGLSAESLVRDAAWFFLDAGRRVERAQQVVALLAHAVAVEHPAGVDTMVVEAALLACESVITFRRRTAAGRVSSPARGALDLLLLERANPRSLAFQLERLGDDLRQLPEHPPVDAALVALVAQVREADLDELCRGDRSALHEVLLELHRSLLSFARLLERESFVHPAPRRVL